MVVLVSILSDLDSVTSIECPTINDTKCETFWQKLFIYPGHNLHEGLKCLNYNGNITYLEAFEDYSAPQKIDIDIISVDIIEVNEEREFGVWKFQTQFTWYDKR